jgi:hypothetical protein
VQIDIGCAVQSHHAAVPAVARIAPILSSFQSRDIPVKKASGTSKPKVAAAKAASRTRPASPAGGLAVTAGKLAARVVAHDGTEQVVRAGATHSFEPVLVHSEAAMTPDIPGFRLAPPASVLWLDISLDGDRRGTITLDPTALLRDGARWGRPVILAHAAQRGAKAWTTVATPTDFELEDGARVRVVGVGHGVAVDAPGVFTSLLRKAASARDVARARAKRSEQ